MKRLKRIASLILALMLMVCMSIAAMGEETTYSITIKNEAEGHTYEAYQIFTGDLSENILSNVKWGSGVSDVGKEVLEDAAIKAESLKSEEDAIKFAEEVANYLTSPAVSSYEVINKKYTISGLEPGYYLIKDKDESLDDKNDAYTSYILEVVKDVTVEPKSGVPEVKKKVQDTCDSESSDSQTTEWKDSADYDIDDEVPFQLEATLPDHISDYKKYEITFEDTLSKGLEYNENCKVKINDENDVTESFTVEQKEGNEGSTILTITCSDVKKLGVTDNDIITVEYTAKLTDDAVIGSAGNTNKVKLKYSNNPNGTGTGETPEDTVIVFTYKVIINKVQKNPEYDPKEEDSKEYIPLEGAGFTLYKMNASKDYDKYVEVGEELTGTDMTTFEWTGLDDGKYKLVETKTPAGYNTIDPIEFEITATHEDGDAPKLTELNGKVIDSTNNSTMSFTTSSEDGSLSLDVVNNKGAELPSTGGMGTTIFYVLGSILVLGTAIVFVVKKRMSIEE